MIDELNDLRKERKQLQEQIQTLSDRLDKYESKVTSDVSTPNQVTSPQTRSDQSIPKAISNNQQTHD